MLIKKSVRSLKQMFLNSWKNPWKGNVEKFFFKNIEAWNFGNLLQTNSFIRDLPGMIRFCVIYSCVPNKQGVLTIRRGKGGGVISKKQIAGEELEKRKRFNFFLKWSINCLMFIIYNQKNTKVKVALKSIKQNSCRLIQRKSFLNKKFCKQQ